MLKRILLISGGAVFSILLLSLFLLDADNPGAGATMESPETDIAGDSGDLAGGEENGGTHAIRAEFEGYYDKTNPATGQTYSENEVGALQYLWDRFPLNKFVQSLINPEAEQDRQKQLYDLALAIQSGQASEEQIVEYYSLREQEIDDKLEVLAATGDDPDTERQRRELKQARDDMYLLRDEQLLEARKRTGGSPASP